MWTYVKAEHLKCKRRFIKPLMILAPAIVLLHAALTIVYYIPNGYNWWYVLILPGLTALMASLVNQYEAKGIHYHGIWTLPMSLRKTWWAKIMLLSLYLSFAGLFHWAVLALGKATIYHAGVNTATYGEMALASLSLIITHLWQLPFCLFLAKNIGTAFTVLINVVGSIVLDIALVLKPIWWLSPYSWGSRLMIPLVGVMPNGLLAEESEPLRQSGVVPVGLVLGLVLFAVISLWTARWFERQEVK